MPQYHAHVDKSKLAITLAITLIAGAMLWRARGFPDRVALFPLVITSIVLMLCIADLVRILRPVLLARPPRAETVAMEGGADGEPVSKDAPQRRAEDGPAEPLATSTAGAIGWFLTLIVMTLLFGFLIAVPLYMALFLRFHGKHSWRAVVISVVSVWVVIYFMFVGLLNLSVFDGYLW